MHRFKTIALCILLMLSCAPLFSKSQSKVDLRYAIGSTIDLQFGYSVMPYSVAGEARNAYGASNGSVFQMRYTYFFGKHFGAFASYSFDQGSNIIWKYAKPEMDDTLDNWHFSDDWKRYTDCTKK